MIIQITFRNYRSIKEEQNFSFEASSSKLKPGNLIRHEEDSNLPTLLKSVAIYGPNASGKSNLIRLMFIIRQFILSSTDLKTGDLISEKYYDPYLLDKDTKTSPTEFSIDFIAFNGKKHRYVIKYSGTEVLYECLGVFESSRMSRIFERLEGSNVVEFFEGMLNKKENKEVPKNNCYLSRFGNSVNEQMTEIYLYFKSIEVWNAVANHHADQLYRKIQSIYNAPGNEGFRTKLNKLINIADTRIEGIEVIEKDRSEFEGLPESIRESMYSTYKYETFGIHPVYADGKLAGAERMSFVDQESQGTKIMFAIGGLFLEAFERKYPTTVFLDEFNNSLHPDLAKFLIELFHNPKVNKNSSQLIFATHDTTFLDSRVFRKDQIWFSEKNKYGSTEFFSVGDFKSTEGLRSDIPFDKWYRSGKFGAVPNIRKFEFIAQYEEN